jgi:hypothetical protein
MVLFAPARAFARCLAILPLLCCLAGCRDEPVAPGHEPVAGDFAAEVHLSILADTLLVGDTLQLEASAHGANGLAVSDRAIRWTTSDPRVVEVSPQGRVTARGLGSAHITAQADTAKAVASIEVDSAIALRLSHTTAELQPGDTLRLSATIVAARGFAFSDRPIEWSTSDSTIAAVDANGRIVALSEGSSGVLAQYRGLRITALVAVLDPAWRPATCAQSGVIHSGTLTGGIWRRVDSPHFLMDTVTVTGNLVIEPGAMVCGRPRSALLFTNRGRLTATGTANRPITFTAVEPNQRWGGILTGTSGGVSITHAVIELGDVLVGAFSAGTISDSHLRRASFHGGGNFSSNSLYRSVVDTGNVTIGQGGTFEENLIRAGSLTLSRSQGAGGVTKLNGGRIENSPGTALTIGSVYSYRFPEVSLGKPIRIKGSRGAPALMPLHTYMNVWSARAAQDSLIGNVSDTLKLYNITGDGMYANLHVRRDQPLSLASLTPYINISTLTMEPGSSLDVGGALLTIHGSNNIVGTPSQPITIRSNSTQCWANRPCSVVFGGTATSRISNVRFTSVYFSTTAQHTVHFNQVTGNFPIVVGSPGSSLTDAHFDDIRGSGYDPNAALWVRANDVRLQRVTIRRTSGSSSVMTRDSAGNARFNNVPLAGILIEGSNVVVQTCDLADNMSDGIRILSGANVQIHDCNFEQNGGAGVNNLGTSLVDALRNWWGDPAGPNGPAGDGVSGNVDFSQAYTQRRN